MDKSPWINYVNHEVCVQGAHLEVLWVNLFAQVAGLALQQSVLLQSRRLQV